MLSRLFRKRLEVQRAKDGGAVVWKTKEKDVSRFSNAADGDVTNAVLRSDGPRRNILVIGDRLATDMILSNRINSLKPASPTLYQLNSLPILTTTLHAPESIGTTILRTLENTSLSILRRRGFFPLLPFQPTTSPTWESCVVPPPVPSASPSPKSIGMIDIVKSHWNEFRTLPQAEPGRQIVVPRFGTGWFVKWRGLFEAFVQRAEKGVVVTESILKDMGSRFMPEKRKRLRLKR